MYVYIYIGDESMLLPYPTPHMNEVQRGWPCATRAIPNELSKRLFTLYAYEARAGGP